LPYLGDAFSRTDADRMLIYQWKKEVPMDAAPGTSIQDFIALAKF